MAEEPDQAPPGDDDRGTGARARLGRWWKHGRSRAVEVGERLPFSDTAVGVYERDKHAAGTLLGSALALRLFLFFVPTVLLLFGVAGILGRYSTVDSSSEFGIGGALGPVYGLTAVVAGGCFVASIVRSRRLARVEEDRRVFVVSIVYLALLFAVMTLELLLG